MKATATHSSAGMPWPPSQESQSRRQERQQAAMFLTLLAISAQLGAIHAHLIKDKGVEKALTERAREATAQAMEMWK